MAVTTDMDGRQIASARGLAGILDFATRSHARAMMVLVVAALPGAPKGGVLIAANSKLPPPLQRFRPGRLPGEGTEPQLRIMFPPNGARLELASGDDGKAEPIARKVAGGSGPLTVLVNGLPLTASPGRRTLFFEPEGPGFVRLTVMDAKGATDSVQVRLQ